MADSDLVSEARGKIEDRTNLPWTSLPLNMSLPISAGPAIKTSSPGPSKPGMPLSQRTVTNGRSEYSRSLQAALSRFANESSDSITRAYVDEDLDTDLLDWIQRLASRYQSTGNQDPAQHVPPEPMDTEEYFRQCMRDSIAEMSPDDRTEYFRRAVTSRMNLKKKQRGMILARLRRAGLPLHEVAVRAVRPFLSDRELEVLDETEEPMTNHWF